MSSCAIYKKRNQNIERNAAGICGHLCRHGPRGGCKGGCQKASQSVENNKTYILELFYTTWFSLDASKKEQDSIYV